ncbi:MAG TPA: hypothetical protein VGM64_15925 [Lacunisphaera sp.]|jgi:hypothetical protein
MKRFLTLVPLLGLALLSTLFLSSCNSNSQVIATGLEVEVTGITQASDGSATVSWQFKNTNVVAYLFSQISLQVSLNGTPLGSIVEKDPLPLPASSNAGRTSKVTTLDATASHALAEAVKAGSANYHIDAQITILVYDNVKEKSVLGNSGTVTVKAE